LLQQILVNVKGVRNIMDENTADEETAELWNRVCYRLDFICLVITNTINILILLLWFAPGWAAGSGLDVADPCVGA
jgi:hypothetical protein